MSEQFRGPSAPGGGALHVRLRAQLTFFKTPPPPPIHRIHRRAMAPSSTPLALGAAGAAALLAAKSFVAPGSTQLRGSSSSGVAGTSAAPTGAAPWGVSTTAAAALVAVAGAGLGVRHAFCSLVLPSVGWPTWEVDALRDSWEAKQLAVWAPHF